MAARVSMSTQVPYSGLGGAFHDARDLLELAAHSPTTEPAARPTACMPMAPNRNGSRPPKNRPTSTYGLDSEKSIFDVRRTALARSWV